MVTAYSDECGALAFYGIKRSTNSLAEFHKHVSAWFDCRGCPADKAAIRAAGHEAKWITAKRANETLMREGFDGIQGLSIAALIPGAKIPVNDYVLTASISLKDDFAFVVWRTSVARLSHDSILPLAETIIKSIQPAYGIGYARIHRQGPAMFAIGICQGLGPNGYGIPSQMTEAERTEADSISHWGEAIQRQVWHHGLLRGVYPMNFLTQEHLAVKVENMSLERWIQKDPDNGNLSKLSGGMVLWQVPEHALTEVRQALQSANHIFDWKKHVLAPLAARN